MNEIIKVTPQQESYILGLKRASKIAKDSNDLVQKK